MISEENIQKYYKDLSQKYLPDFLNDLPEQKTIMKINSREMARVNFLFQDVLNQLNVDTATWGLIFYEDYYGIPYNPNLSYEDRRKNIKLEMFPKDPTTTELIKKLASIYSEEVEVIRHDYELWIDIILLTTHGFENFMERLMKKIYSIIPAHIGSHFTLVSNEKFESNYYAGAVAISTSYYLLTSDLNEDYILESDSKIGATSANTETYVLTSELNDTYELECENNNVSVILSTQNYILK